MPRAKGQCDPLKTEAILDAAARQIRVCGAMGSIDEIARQAGVSKQTIYNQFGSRSELLKTLLRHDVNDAGVLLARSCGDAAATLALTALAKRLLQFPLHFVWDRSTPAATALCADGRSQASRGSDLDPCNLRQTVSRFLACETHAGRLNCSDPELAAGLFIGMISGCLAADPRKVAGSETPATDIDGIAEEVAFRFVRAFEPDRADDRLPERSMQDGHSMTQPVRARAGLSCSLQIRESAVRRRQ